MDENPKPFTPDWNKVFDRLENNSQLSDDLSTEEQALLEELRSTWAESAEAFTLYQSFDTDRKWSDLKEKIGEESVARPLVQKTTYPLWRKFTVAAAVLVLVAAAILYFQKETQKQKLANIIINDVAPGKNSATLTLQDGKKIVLSDAGNGQLAKEAGVIITKTADGQVIYSVGKQGNAAGANKNTLSTARGETYRLRLPDQSEVWLNAASSITFPASFADAAVREVQLSGEAYFEIAKDRKHPFIVKTQRQEIQVLGTHFNLNDDQEQDKTTTTLLEGSLRVINKEKASRLIKPGQQSVLGKDDQLLISGADIKQTMAWKNGYFRFQAESIESIMLKISRWYNIDVIYEGKIPVETFSGNISRNKNISEVLKMLSYSESLKFKVEGRRVTVMQ